jgi:prepilin-type N-terminal cleavage/methylation domain-containing protein
VLRRNSGFSILELMVVVAVLGVLLGIGFVNLPRDRFALNQAAEGLSRDVQLARFQAISRNTFVVLEVNQAANGYDLRERDGGRVLKTVRFGDSSTPQVRVQSVSPSAATLVFDPRGVGIGTNTQTVVLQNASGSYRKTLTLNTQGKVTVQ